MGEDEEKYELKKKEREYVYGLFVGYLRLETVHSSGQTTEG